MDKPTSAKEAFIKRAYAWSKSFISQHLDAEGKFLPQARYEIKGLDLRRALVAAYAAGKEDRDDRAKAVQT